MPSWAVAGTRTPNGCVQDGDSGRRQVPLCVCVAQPAGGHAGVRPPSWWRRTTRRWYALVARVLGAGANADDVDDVAQEVFVQAWRGLPKFRHDAQFSTWLYRIATNMAIKQWHRRKRLAQTVSEEELPNTVRAALAMAAPGPEDVAALRARDRALRTAIERLPEKQRTVILLHYFEDYTCEEVAALLGCSVGTVWSRLHYAGPQVCADLVGWMNETKNGRRLFKRNEKYYVPCWSPTLEGDLDDVRAADLRARLAEDPALAAEAERLRLTLSSLRETSRRTPAPENAAVPADLWPRLRDRLDPAPALTVRRAAPAGWLAAVGAAAAVAFAAIWLPVGQPRETGKSCQIAPACVLPRKGRSAWRPRLSRKDCA